MGLNQRGLYSLATDAEDPAYVKGNWYSIHDGTVGAGAVLVASRLTLTPFRIRQLVNIAQIGARITTLAAAGNIQLGIYPAHRDTLAPTGPPLIQTASLSTAAASVIAGPHIGAAAVQLPRGIYWFGIMADAAAAGTAIMQNLSIAGSTSPFLIGALTQATASAGPANAACTRIATVTYGTWPDLTGAGTTTENTGAAFATGQFQVAA